MADKAALNIIIAGDGRGARRALRDVAREATQMSASVRKTSAVASTAFQALGVEAKRADRAARAMVLKQRESVRQLGNVAKRSAMVFAGFAVAASAHILKVGREYESEMSRVQGVLEATRAEMRGLDKLALKMGAATKFSAAEAASAMYELGAAGFSVREQYGALPGTLALAAASSVELADAAEISSNALRGFGLASDQSARVADVLAQTVNTTSTEMSDMQDSLKYIGPIAKVTGQSFEGMSAAIGLMGDAGIKGSKSGTALRSGLVRLVNPVKKTKDGLEMLGLSASDLQGPNGLLPLTQIVGKLEKGAEGLSVAERNQALAMIFGTEALSGMLAVVNAGPEKLRRVTRELENSTGAAARAARVMNDNVEGAWEEFTGSLETIEIKLYKLAQGPIKRGLREATRVVNREGKLLNRDLSSLLANPEFRQGDFAKKVDMLVGVFRTRWRESGFGDVLRDLFVQGVEFAVPFIAESAGRAALTAAESFAKAFASSGWLGKLVLGSWLFSKFGGFAALRGLGWGMGQQVSVGFSNALASGVATYMMGGGVRGGLSAALVPMFKGLARAAAPMAAVAGVGDALMSAVSGDVKAAAGKGAGALVGGIAGAFLGGPVGAMLGAGVGSFGGGLITKLIGGDSEANAAKARLKDVGKVAAASAQTQADALRSVGRVSGRVKGHQREAAQAARRVERAEKDLLAVRAEYGPNSAQAIRAEARLAQAKSRSADATDRLKRSQRLHGEVLKAAKVVTRGAIADNKALIGQKEEERREAHKAWKQLEREGASRDEMRAATGKFLEKDREVADAYKERNRILRKSAREIGPKWTDTVAKMSEAELAFGKAGRATVRTVLRPLANGMFDTNRNARLFARETPKAYEKVTRSTDEFKDSSTELRKATNRNWRLMPPVQAEASRAIVTDLEDKIGFVKNLGSPRRERKRRGGRLGKVAAFAAGGLVAAMMSPGELLHYPDGSWGRVPGTPVAADNVFMPAPDGTEVFTWSGQQLLASGASRSEALRRQAPHFAKGGKVRGGTPKGQEFVNAGLSSLQAVADRTRRQSAGDVSLGDAPPSLRAAMRLAQAMGLTITSTTGGTHTEGSWHYSGRAFDASNGSGPTGEMMAFAKAVAKRWGSRALELFYNPLGWFIKNGSVVSGNVDDNHWNHVHVAMRRGGLIRRFRDGGQVRGRVSWFGGGRDTQEVASGGSSNRPGLALNLKPGTDSSGWNNPTTQGWMQAAKKGKPVYARVTIAGKSAVLPIIDLGPHQDTGRAIDVTQKGLEKMGFTTDTFPTDAIGTVTILGSSAKALEKAAPVSDGQKKAAVRLQKTVKGLAGGVRDVAGQFKRYGGTRQGRKALKRAQGLAKSIGKLGSMSDRDEARKTLDKRRKAVKRLRDALGVAAEGAGTPGLRPGKVSAAAETALRSLPRGVARRYRLLLRQPGLTPLEVDTIIELAFNEAQLTGTSSDDREVLRWQNAVLWEREQAIKKRIAALNRQLKRKGLPKKKRAALLRQRNSLIADRKELVTGQRDAVASIRDLVPSASDRAEHSLAMASLIPDEAARNREMLRVLQTEAMPAAQAQLEAAKGTADLQDDIEAANLIVGLRDQIAALSDAIDATKEWERERTEAMRMFAEEAKRENDRAEHVMAISSREAIRMVTDMVSGGVAGRIPPRALATANGQQWRF